MKYVLDASVAVAALRPREPHHAAALNRCLPFFAGRDEIVVPAIFDVEVHSALARRQVPGTAIAGFFAKHLASRRLVTIGPRAVRAARGVVTAARLRAADALYVWVAAKEQLPLVTLDDEVLKRAAAAGVSASAP